MSNSPKKTVWSLQDNKRTEAQREAFKPTGKKPKSKTLKYLLVSAAILFLFSFLLIQINEDRLETCITESFCINTEENILLYTIYIFINICVVLLAISGAYIIGKKLAAYFKLGQ